MALSNLNKETLNNLFTMLSVENIENNKILTQIRSDYSAYGKLSLIEKQISFLKLEAINIINEYNLNNEVNNIQCNFKKIPGNYYYIYSNDATKFISLIAPDEWYNKSNFLMKVYMDYDNNFYKCDI